MLRYLKVFISSSLLCCYFVSAWQSMYILSKKMNLQCSSESYSRGTIIIFSGALFILCRIMLFFLTAMRAFGLQINIEHSEQCTINALFRRALCVYDVFFLLYFTLIFVFTINLYRHCKFYPSISFRRLKIVSD